VRVIGLGGVHGNVMVWAAQLADLQLRARLLVLADRARLVQPA
jgi:hypothetical protein